LALNLCCASSECQDSNLAITQIYNHIVDKELEEALKSSGQPAAVVCGVGKCLSLPVGCFS